MIKLSPILIMIAYGWIYLKFSVWSTSKNLKAKSRPLNEKTMYPVLDQLADALDLPRVLVYLYDIPQINGLAAPDGRIYITRGFIDKLKLREITEPELASVIAHELGHVALNHSRRRMVDFGVQNAARAVLIGMIGRFIPFVGPLIANFVINALMAKLSRTDEFEADEYASALMIKAGFGTEPQVSLFEKLDKWNSSSNGTPAWLLSHPKPAERIAAIQSHTAKWMG